MTEAFSEKEPSSSEVMAALEHIVHSMEFGEKSRASAILRYVTIEELEGRGGLLKAYPIGVDVLDRSADFDPSADSIVRVEAKRLRLALEKYYATSGKDAPVIIDLPKGSYRPAFRMRNSTRTVGATPEKPRVRWIQSVGLFAVLALVAILAIQAIGNKPQRAKPPEMARTAITIMVRPRPEGIESGKERERVDNLVGQLRASLARNDGLVVFAPATSDSAADRLPAEFDFVLEGSVETLVDEDRLTVELLNGRTNEMAWGGTVEIDRKFGGSGQDEAITKIMRDLNPRIFGASKAALEGRDPETLTAHQLFVASTWIPGFAENSLEWEKERLELAKMALDVDPDFGPAHSVVADKLAYLATVDPPSNTPEAFEQAAASAQRAQQLSPGDENVLFNIAIYHWHVGEMKASQAVMRRVADMNPDHSFARVLVTLNPYTCVSAPDEIVEAATNFDESLGADNPVRWVTLSWLSILHLNRGDYATALDAEERAAQIFQTPGTVMRRALILNQMGRAEDAAKVILAQRQSWPNIDPGHFASFTIPMRCQESPEAAPLLAAYTALAKAMEGRLK